VRVGRVSRPSSVWRPTNCAWMFGRRPGAPCSDTANTSVPWTESLQDTTRVAHLLPRVVHDQSIRWFCDLDLLAPTGPLRDFQRLHHCGVDLGNYGSRGLAREHQSHTELARRQEPSYPACSGADNARHRAERSRASPSEAYRRTRIPFHLDCPHEDVSVLTSTPALWRKL